MGADAPAGRAPHRRRCCPPARPSTSITCRAGALADTLPALIALSEAGLEPVPHVAVRRIASRAEAEAFLRQAVAQGGRAQGAADRRRRPASRSGPTREGAALLRDGLLVDCGVAQVGLPGYPEGHPRIATAALTSALADKLGARAQARASAPTS